MAAQLVAEGAAQRPILIENCHWGADLAAGASPGECPYHFARTSPDVTARPSKAVWNRVFLNLQAMARTNGFARPGCWGYADMSQTGNFVPSPDTDAKDRVVEAGDAPHAEDRDQEDGVVVDVSEGHPRPAALDELAAAPATGEDRAAFGGLCITSSPIILSFDLRDDRRLGRVWDVITNRYALAVNQNWAGHAGRLVYSWDPPPPVLWSGAGSTSYLFLWAVPCDDFADDQTGFFEADGEFMCWSSWSDKIS